MARIKSYSVAQGDMFCIRHGSDSFTIIDCDLTEQNAGPIIADLRGLSAGKGISRFICTHPDDDHFGGIHLLDRSMPIVNFYCVRNQATKDTESESFQHYCQLRDSNKAFYISKGCKRRWLNDADDARQGAGIQILWPDLQNASFKRALAACDAGESFNNTSAVIRYEVHGGASFLWLGDLETDFMEEIVDHITLRKTTVVFASHHGRDSGKIPNSWLRQLDPQIVVIGEAPSRHLNYYTGYRTLTQNRAGDITFECDGDKVHVFTSEQNYRVDFLRNEGFQLAGTTYLGTLTVETQYTL
jgi:beta-lactamase superfamily II metal-dependent hydrolase